MDFRGLEQKMSELNSGAFFKMGSRKKKDPDFHAGFSSKQKLDSKTKYLQIAFNGDTQTVNQVLPQIPKNPRIIIEAGTPYLKRNGSAGISLIRSLWPAGLIVADLKIMDGALGEVQDAVNAGADAVTVLGSASKETISLVVSECKKIGAISMVDMLDVADPLRVLMKAKATPDVVVLHRGRDEENVYGKVIEYKQVKRIKSKFNSLISAAGGVDLKEAQSASFNGATIVVVNLVRPEDPWEGIRTDSQVKSIAEQFLKTIE